MIEAEKRDITIALLQEPYVGNTKEMRGYKGARIFQCTSPGEGTVKAAIAVFKQDIYIRQYPELTTNNFCVIGATTGAKEITLVSYYFEPDRPIEPYLRHLALIGEKIGHNRLIIGGDANAKSVWWGSDKGDTRGQEMAGVLEEMALQVLNAGQTPTFDTIRGNQRYSSCVDVTAVSLELLDRVDNWKVVEDLTGSDHNGIVFELHTQKCMVNKIERTTRKYNTRRANWDDFHKKIKQLLLENKITKAEIQKVESVEKLEKLINKVTDIITKTCNETIPKKSNREKLTVPWWSEELETQKRKVATKKNRIKCAAPVRRAKVIAEYVAEKEDYEANVTNAQIRSWKDFCGKQDREGVWEGIYRVIGRTKKREEDLPLIQDGKTLDARGSAELLAKTFYPKDSNEEDNEEHRILRNRARRINEDTEDQTLDPPFTSMELNLAVNSFNPKKAPGADGFTADICTHTINRNADVFLDLFNKCLEHHHFPNAWKEATVVVLRKPGKDTYTSPKSYRPIGLLPVLGKILEKMIVHRLRFHVVPRLSRNQYGFMPQRSTEDSLYTLMQYIKTKLDQKKIVTMVSLDIEGAFDSAWWPAIRVRLAEEGCPWNLRRLMDSYLRDRKVRVRYGGEEYVRETEKGCVQGSIGGPILWNILLDPLLKGLEQRGDYAQAFADDVVMIFDGQTALEVEGRANAALEHVRAWGVANKLKFAPGKTHAMVITRKLKYDTPRLSMGGVDVCASSEIKLLGVIIDQKLTFNSHVKAVCNKAIGIYKQLSRAAKISWGLHPEVVRSIYTAAVEPVILYAASVWAPAVNKLGIQKQLNVVQRGFAQKLCRAYRTVSLNSALVLAGILPLDLRVREAASLYEAKRGVSQPGLADREVEQMSSALKSPHPAEYMTLGFEALVDQEQLDQNNGFELCIYTDGSKIQGKVGAALSMWNGETETKTLKLALPSFCTVYQAELLALCRATREAVHQKATNSGIYSDSMAALQTVTNVQALHPLAVKARENLREALLQGKRVSLFWIKAHAGLGGNERADCLAKEAALTSKRKPDYDKCPVSFVRRNIRMRSLDEWNIRYKSGETAGITKIFFPDAVEAYKVVRKLEPDTLLTQMMTGHGGFSEYLHRFKCKDNPSCVCEPGKVESVPHILLECPVHSLERLEIETKLEQEMSIETLSSIMTGKKLRKFIEYGKQIVSKVNNRNK